MLDARLGERDEPRVMDITALMNQYRECVRHVWNGWFYQSVSSREDWDLRDRFERIRLALFEALVVCHVAPVAGSTMDRVDSMVPMAAIAIRINGRSSIMVNRGVSTGYWDDPLDSVVADDVDLRLIGLFDWSELGFRECSLYRVRIVASARFPSVVGRDALVPASDATVRVVYLPEEQS
jgi:hypothetical protein